MCHFKIIKYITDKEELRKVEFPKNIPNVIDCDGKGYFYFWFEKEHVFYAMVEAKDGTMRKINAGNLQFVNQFSGERSASL